MATPTSAWARAGASFVPSPHMATSLPLACSSRISDSLFSGVACARKSSTPASAAIAAAVIGLSPVIMTVRMPIRRSSAKRSRMPPLTMSLSWTMPSRRPSRATASGVPPALAISSAMACSSRTTSVLLRMATAALPRNRRQRGADIGKHGIDRALADRRAFDIHAAHARLGGEGHEGRLAGSAISRPRMPYFSLASTTIERPSRVSSASDASCAASARSCSVTPRSGRNGCRLAVAEGDRAGFIEQQCIDVTGCFDGATRHSKHVEAHETVHAGNADRREERADSGRDQCHEESNEDDDWDRAAGIARQSSGSLRRPARRSSSCRRAGC